MAVGVDGRAAGEEDDAVLVVEVVGVVEVRLRVEGVVAEDTLERRRRHRQAAVEGCRRVRAGIIEDREWSWWVGVDALWEERQRQVAESAVGERHSRGDAWGLVLGLQLGGVGVVG